MSAGCQPVEICGSPPLFAHWEGSGHLWNGCRCPALISGLGVKCQVQPSRSTEVRRRPTCEPASLPISLGIHLHRGVIWQVPISASTGVRSSRSRWIEAVLLGGRIQITPRCALIERIGQLATGCRGSGPYIPFQTLRLTATRTAAGPNPLSASSHAQCRTGFLRSIRRGS